MPGNDPNDLRDLYSSRKYSFLTSLNPCSDFESSFWTAARDLVLEKALCNQELEILFVAMLVAAKRDLNLIPVEKRPWLDDKDVKLRYSGRFCDPLMDRHRLALKKLSRTRGPGFHFQCFRSYHFAKAILAGRRAGQPEFPCVSAWKRAAAGFQADDFSRAYVSLAGKFAFEGRKRTPVATEIEQTVLLLRFAALLFCHLKMYSEYRCALSRAFVTNGKDLSLLEPFASKYERSPIRPFQRCAAEELTWIVTQTELSAFQRFQVQRRILRYSIANSLVGPKVMKYCLSRKTHYSLAEQVFPTLRRIGDQKDLEVAFRRWRRDRKTQLQKGPQ